MFQQRTMMAALILGLTSAATTPLVAYGPIGHQIIGAVADAKIAETAAGKKVPELLDGMTLEKVSVIPDEIRGWDKPGPDDPAIFHYSAHPRIDAQLRDYWKANPPTKDLNSPTPSHHWFHYTDVPVRDPEKYGDGTAGRSKWDIVHAISYCIAVLKGDEPADNARKITKPIAVILLAHFVGDIHQPLHVGAEFFDAEGHPSNPGQGTKSFEDQGGNSITLNWKDSANPQGEARHSKFHSFWDTETVMANFPAFPDTMEKEERRAKTDAAKGELIHEFITQAPDGWRLPESVALKDYAEAWANEVLPMAREAHERLQFHDIVPARQEDGTTIAVGAADEKPGKESETYRDWSAQAVRRQLPKAGWRLADLLQKALQ